MWMHITICDLSGSLVNHHITNIPSRMVRGGRSLAGIRWRDPTAKLLKQLNCRPFIGSWRPTYRFDHKNGPRYLALPNDFPPGCTCSLSTIALIRTLLDGIKWQKWRLSSHNKTGFFRTVIPKQRRRIQRFIYRHLFAIFGYLSDTFLNGGTDQWCVSGQSDSRPKCLITQSLQKINWWICAFISISHDWHVSQACKFDDGVQKIMHFAVVYLKTIQFTWLETPMSEKIRDKINIGLDLATDLLIDNRFKGPSQYKDIVLTVYGRPGDHLTFNMGIPIPGTDGHYIETGPGSEHFDLSSESNSI